MYLLVTVQTALAGIIAGKAAMHYVLPAYDSFTTICMILARIPDANDLLVPGRSSSLKALVWMQEVRHAQLQYGRHCSHHDDTAPTVPHRINKTGTCTNLCIVQRTRGLRKLVPSFLRTVSLACKKSCCSSFVTHEHRDWVPSCWVKRFCLSLRFCLMHEHPADNVHRSDAYRN